MPDYSPLVRWDAEDYDLLDRMHTALGTALQAMDEAKRLRVERDEYKKKYNDLLDDSLEARGRDYGQLDRGDCERESEGGSPEAQTMPLSGIYGSWIVYAYERGRCYHNLTPTG